jgi:hypothetical protein
MTNEYKIWLNKNPLTSWMRRNKATQMQVAARLGVSTYAVYLWQHGTSVPSPERFDRIKKLTGINDIIHQWAEWKDEFQLEPTKRG